MTKPLTSLDSPLRIASVHAGHGGRIGMTICPGKKSATSISGHGWERDLSIDIQAIRDWGADAVITLMEDWELRQYEVENLGSEIRAAGMTWFHLPIVDGRAPSAEWDAEWISTYQETLCFALQQGKSILIHCLGGRGRTGTVAALLLMSLGDSAETAISRVRAAREGMIETIEQEQYLRQPTASVLSSQRKWRVTIEDAGNGDGSVPIPDEIIDMLGWQESDQINVEVVKPGEILISRISDNGDLQPSAPSENNDKPR